MSRINLYELMLLVNVFIKNIIFILENYYNRKDLIQEYRIIILL